MERTLVILKPDALHRQLLGRILTRFETKGLKLVGLKMVRLSRSVVEKQYAAHVGKDFYEPLLNFMTAGPVVLVVVEGRSAVAVVRSMMGPTFGPDAPPGTIRGDFGLSKRYNLIHGSDSPESADFEIGLYFTEDEIVEYEFAHQDYLYGEND